MAACFTTRAAAHDPKASRADAERSPGAVARCVTVEGSADTRRAGAAAFAFILVGGVPAA